MNYFAVVDGEAVMNDALRLPGNELLHTHTKENRIDLDSDILAIEKGLKPMYSKETCQWIPCSVNSAYKPTVSSQEYRKGNIFHTDAGVVVLLSKTRRKWFVEFEDGKRHFVCLLLVKEGTRIE